MNFDIKKIAVTTLSSGILASALTTTALADFVINDDLIVDGSACVGFDCVNGEAFGFDTLRLKENNLRIAAVDTSTAASFPSADWTLVFNDSANGGASRFSVEETSSGTVPFTIRSNAPSNSLFVSSIGNVGIGEVSPSVELHVQDGDTPTMRLEQDGSSGFAPQTWDVAGNETNFFVRDVSNGSVLPFRIRPGAPSSAIDISANGDVGVGTSNPQRDLHVLNTTDGEATEFQVENSDGGAAQVRIVTTNANNRRVVGLSEDGVTQSEIRLRDNRISFIGDSGNTLAIMNATGFEVGGTLINVPDYVFEDDYNLRPLQEVSAFIDMNGHLPDVPSAATVNENGLNMTQMQMVLLRKVEELTLYTLEQDARINNLVEELEIVKVN